MPLLIDAWNFIRNDRSLIPDDGDDSLDAAAELIAYFEAYQETHNDPVILVFDSTREHLGIDHANAPRLKVIASANADAYIKRYLDKTPEQQRRAVRVVSSDNDVYYYAKSFCATPIRSEEFWARLRRG